MNQIKRVSLTLKTEKPVAQEAAQAVLNRSNPHASLLVESKLESAGVNTESLMKYFTQIGAVVAEFWNAGHDPNFKPTLKSHEVRNLYLPIIYGVIFASVGNVRVGNYEYQIVANNQEVKVERDWLIDFSAKLESLREYILGNVGQIGNYNAIPQTTVMLALLGQVAVDGRSALMHVRDGVTYDHDLAGLATLVGLTLVNQAYDILYTGVDEVNFRELIGTIVHK
jgi:hypothetical protein